MARADRCEICDYSEPAGSNIGNKGPGSNGKVRMRGDEMLCDVCSSAVDLTLFQLKKDEDDDPVG